MKRFFLIVPLLTIFLIGCPAFLQNLNDYAATETGALILQEAGEIAGAVVGFEDQAKIEENIQYCDNILSQQDESLKQRLLEEAYALFFKKYGHNPQTALLMRKATKLLGLVIKGDKLEFLEGYDLAGIDLFIKAFRDGLSLAVPRFAPKYFAPRELKQLE
jgi:hypothetical protein